MFFNPATADCFQAVSQIKCCEHVHKGGRCRRDLKYLENWWTCRTWASCKLECCWWCKRVIFFVFGRQYALVVVLLGVTASCSCLRSGCHWTCWSCQGAPHQTLGCCSPLSQPLLSLLVHPVEQRRKKSWEATCSKGQGRTNLCAVAGKKGLWL